MKYLCLVYSDEELLHSLPESPKDSECLAYAEIRIGDSTIMLAEEATEWGALGPKSLKGSPVTIHLYVKNVDAFVERAGAAEAKITMPVSEFFGRTERAGPTTPGVSLPIDLFMKGESLVWETDTVCRPDESGASPIPASKHTPYNPSYTHPSLPQDSRNRPSHNQGGRSI